MIMQKRFVLVLALLISGCGSVSMVNAIATSADGKSVVAVGTRSQRIVIIVPVEPTQPRRWLCTRSESGELSCKLDGATLPQLD